MIRRTYLAIALIVVSLVVLETARRGVEMARFTVGETPVTSYAQAQADGPVVVIAHGFAGSQQMMQGYALPLARAGYRVFAFEFLGHGRHPLPMSGDVGSVGGTTQLLVDQTNAVIEAVAAEERVALLGHSMATDVLVRTARTRTDVGPIILISAFSQVIDATTPADLLLITGAWEPGLRAFGLEAAQMVDPEVGEGETAVSGATQRRAVAAPFAEHVSVLHSRAGRAAALAWLDRAYERRSDQTIWPSGWAILGLLAGLVLLYRRVATVLPARAVTPPTTTRRQTAALLLVPALVTPFVVVPLDPGFLPVLVADYLGAHLFLFGALQLALLRFWRVPLGQVFFLPAFGLLLIWCAVFGFALDRYAANFWPTPERLWIIALLALGAVPYMVADAVLTAGSGLGKRLLIRLSFLASLGIAVALDFESLFFIIMIAPVLVLFYLVFGTMGRDTAAKAGPVTAGLALGVVLAWALGVSFPLFET